MPSRALVAVAVSVALAGCFGGGPAAGPTSPEPTDGAHTIATETATPIPDVGPGPHPGHGEPISTNASGTPEDVRYFPENDTIRYVAAWRHANHEEVVEEGVPPEREPVYEYIAFEEWTEFHAPDVGREAVSTGLLRRLDGADRGVSVAVGVRNAERRVIVKRVTTKDREGRVVGEPNVSYARLVAVSPRNVTVRLAVGDRRYERTYPVVVENVTTSYS